jgi:hypothetical protein
MNNKKAKALSDDNINIERISQILQNKINKSKIRGDNYENFVKYFDKKIDQIIIEFMHKDINKND